MGSKSIKANIDGIAVLDGQRKYEYVDQTFASLYDYQNPSDLIGETWDETFALPHIRRFEKELLPKLKEEQKWTGVVSGLKRNGERFAQKISLFYLKDGKLVSLVKNVTPEGRSIFKLGRPEHNWPEAIESAPDIVAIISLDYEIEQINPTGAEKLNIEASDVEGHKCYEVVHRLNSPIKGCPCKKAIETREAGIGEVTEDGTNYVVTAFPLMDNSEELTAFLHTVTRVSNNSPGELKACEFFIRELTKLEKKDQILSFLLHSIREVLEPAKITLYKSNSKTLKCLLQTGYRRSMIGENLHKSGTGARVETAKKDKSFYLPDVTIDENFIRYDPEVKCEFVAPISSSNNCYGVLDIRKLEKDSISPSERNLIEIMTSEVGKILENLPSNTSST
ncbi:MAG: PAS domain-containing protein [Candidatus Bipolaricaulia bacterium]